ERPEPYRDKDRMPELCDSRERVGAVGGDADLRPRLLIGPRRSLHILETVILALVGKRLLGPGPLQDFERLGEALAALAIGHAIGFVSAREAAAPDPEDEPATADLVERRDFLGQPQRVTQRQYLHRGADLHALCARVDRARHRPRRRQYR